MNQLLFIRIRLSNQVEFPSGNIGFIRSQVNDLLIMGNVSDADRLRNTFRFLLEQRSQINEFEWIGISFNGKKSFHNLNFVGSINQLTNSLGLLGWRLESNLVTNNVLNLELTRTSDEQIEVGFTALSNNLFEFANR